MSLNRTLYLAFVIAACLFVYALSHHSKQWVSATAEAIQGNLVPHRSSSSDKSSTSRRPNFEQIARKYGTDKVTTHKYQFMYDKYLSSIRDEELKVLEIGLGCNMVSTDFRFAMPIRPAYNLLFFFLSQDYGPGASYYTWLEYLPFVDLYFIEYDGQCAEKYQDKTANAHVFIGDQTDTVFLARFSAEATTDGLFDVIIDDGGHTMNQQITSLEVLWETVKPGGLYVIEDLQTSYWESFGGDPAGRRSSKETTMSYLYQLIDDLMIGNSAKQISHEVLSIDCMAEICALRKKEHL
ncbi:hard-surface induced protein 5 [Trichoderma harzianum]|uniref:Hard-surface induced protein 5 n=1 Tax=Trichoderma harzianum TaxID=5544 RepID=A0A0F9XNY2_TRIHA|nr:hard-surface induced protein 5 [Trichoderma harzianum]